MKVFESLAGPMSIDKLLRAYRAANNLTITQLESKIGHKGKKKFTLKEVIKVARRLDEDEDFYAMVWFMEEARRVGLDVTKYFRDLR